MSKMILLAALLLPAGGAFAASGVRVAPDKLVWSDGGADLPKGTRVAVLEGDLKQPGLFTARVKLPSGSVLAAHWHASDERVTVLSGSVYVGLGDVLDKKAAEKLPAQSFYINPARANHYLWTDSEAVLQVTAQGPWEVHAAAEKPAAAAAPAAPRQPGIAELKAGKVAAGSYPLQAYVVSVGGGQITIADERDGQDRLVILTGEPRRFEVGQLYGFTVRLTDRKSSFEGQAYDVELGR